MAVAAVGLTFLLMLLWFAAALLFRCRFQYSLRSLFCWSLAVAIPCSWLAVEMQHERKQNGGGSRQSGRWADGIKYRADVAREALPGRFPGVRNRYEHH